MVQYKVLEIAHTNTKIKPLIYSKENIEFQLLFSIMVQ